MTTITIRDLRQRWPDAEKALETEGELIITRDGKPVAKLVPFCEPKRRPQFDPIKQLARLKRISRGKVYSSSVERLSADRNDRFGHS